MSLPSDPASSSDMTDGQNVDLVVCAAPLARYASRIAAELQADGWHVSIVSSVNAREWLDVEPDVGREVDAATRRPHADVVVAIPATFNTLNKLRHGISDTPALGALNDAIGTRLPLLVVPMVSERLVNHPAWIDTEDWLRRLDVCVIDPADGRTDRLNSLRSGTGDDVARVFDVGAVLRWLKAVS